LIIDLFVEGKKVNLNIVNSIGNIHTLDANAGEELKRLLIYTSKAKGKLGHGLLARWQKFYDTNLSLLNKPTIWESPDGKTVKIKPTLIIKSNEVNHKYANLEKVPALVDNFTIFIASKLKEAKDISETSAKELVAKINDIPKIRKDNIVFVIRLPKMNKEGQIEWHREINELREVIGKENVLFNPSKDEFSKMLQNRGKDIIAVEMTHTDKGIVLKNNARYTSKDVQQAEDLSHIKYLLSGLGTCQLPRLEQGNFVSSLRKKGVGIVNGSFREASADIALKRLREFIKILRNIEGYDIYPYHLLDIIDQRLNIQEKGTINLGKMNNEASYFIQAHKRDIPRRSSQFTTIQSI